MADGCFETDSSLYINGDGKLAVQYATGSGIETIDGEGVSLETDQLSPVVSSFTPKLYFGTTSSPWTQGNGTAYGRYIQTGKLIHYQFELHMGSTSSTPAGSMWIDLPVIADVAVFDNNNTVGHARLINSGIGSTVSWPSIQSTNGGGFASFFYTQYGTSINDFLFASNGSPFSLGVADAIVGWMTYFAA